jgi:hypothetical protein
VTSASPDEELGVVEIAFRLTAEAAIRERNADRIFYTMGRLEQTSALMVNSRPQVLRCGVVWVGVKSGMTATALSANSPVGPEMRSARLCSEALTYLSDHRPASCFLPARPWAARRRPG